MVEKSDSLEITSRPQPSVVGEMEENNAYDVEKHTANENYSRETQTTLSRERSDQSATHEYASPRELTLLSTVFTIATFMIAIDGSILATAIPHITTDFHRLDDVSWYGSAYLLTEMSFQPTFGRLYSLFDAKILYLFSVIIFEVGSILCAASPNSATLIIGRAISGAGAAGLLCGSLAIYGRSVPLRARPFGMALVTSMYGIAGVLGPTLGGLITDTRQLTWRFCFWFVAPTIANLSEHQRANFSRINLPAGAVTFGIAFWTFKRKSPIYSGLSLPEKIKRLDLLGAFLLTSGLVALFIALQWGGSKYQWSNPKVYASVVTFGILITAFVVLQAMNKERATIPIRILSQRTVAISCTFNMLMSMAQNTHGYYMAFYFQTVLGTNAVTSGVRCLAYGIPGSIAILITGAFISSKGHYVPFMWLGTCIFIAGCALMRTLNIDSSPAQWICYQIISGFGIGLAEQVPFIAVQVVLPDDDMPTACAMVVFSRCFGGAVGLSIATNLFSGALLPKLAHTQGVDVSTIVAAGASDLAAAVPAEVLPMVRKAFGYAITRTFILPIVVAGLSLILSFGMQRRWIPDDRLHKNDGEVPDASGTILSEPGKEERNV